MTKIFPVKTGKILLHPFQLKDAAAKAQLDNDPDIKEYLGRPTKLEDDITEFENQGYGLVAIVDIASNQIAGYAKLQSPDWEKNLGLELIVAVSSIYRKQGFALEAIKKLIEISFGLLQQKQVVGRIAFTNTASIKLVEKVDMKEIGRRQDILDGDQYIFSVSSWDNVR